MTRRSQASSTVQLMGLSAQRVGRAISAALLGKESGYPPRKLGRPWCFKGEILIIMG